MRKTTLFALALFAAANSAFSQARAEWKAGLVCLAYRPDDGCFHPGTVVEKVTSNAGTLYRFVFSDSGQALVVAAEMRPLVPLLKAGTKIVVSRSGRESAPATVARLVGAAAFVRFADGAEDWISLSNLAVRSSEAGPPPGTGPAGRQ